MTLQGFLRFWKLRNFLEAFEWTFLLLNVSWIKSSLIYHLIDLKIPIMTHESQFLDFNLSLTIFLSFDSIIFSLRCKHSHVWVIHTINLYMRIKLPKSLNLNKGHMIYHTNNIIYDHFNDNILMAIEFVCV